MSRKLHRWVALLTAVPLTLVVLTGCLLQIKRWIPVIQPPSQKSEAGPLTLHSKPLALPELLQRASLAVPATFRGWDDVHAIDIRPKLGVARIRSKDFFEVQLDLFTGEVLSAQPRFSSLLLQLHEGAFFGAAVRDFVFVPSSALTLLLTLSGLWILFRYYQRKGRATWRSHEISPALDSD